MGAAYRIAGVKVKIDPALLGNFIRGADGTLPIFMRTHGTVVQLAAMRDAPGHGRLKASIIKRDFPTLTGYSISIIAATPYAYWVHEGTGIYGPHGQRIYPRTSTVLAWMGSAGEMIFATSTAGMRPRPFLRKNLPLFFAGE